MKILICGLPGSGKTWLAERLVQHIKNCAWYNADILRSSSNDWDFSSEGRRRQANRMRTFADFEVSNNRWVVCDFVAPTKESRTLFSPDYVIWLDTVKEGRVVDTKKEELKDARELPFEVDTLATTKEFEDTNKVFDPPDNANQRIISFLSDDEIQKLATEILDSV